MRPMVCAGIIAWHEELDGGRYNIIVQGTVRARILAEPNGEWDHPLASFVYETFSNMLPVRQPLDWEPTPDDTMASIAEREGRPAQEVVYDFLTEGELARRLRMSKTPVRTALTRLEIDGFVTVSPQQGIVVREPG